MDMVLTPANYHITTSFTPGVEKSIAGTTYRTFSSVSFTNNLLFPFFFGITTQRNRPEPLPMKMTLQDNSTEFLNGIHYSYIGGSITSSALRKNVQKVESFITLEDGWDGENGKKFSRDFINSIIGLLRQLDKQPEVFPISDGSIQLEYETDQGEYLEFEISEDNRVVSFHIDQDGEETQNSFFFDIDNIKGQVAGFNG